MTHSSIAASLVVLLATLTYIADEPFKIEEINPLPIGYSEFHDAGEAYKSAMEWAVENNVHGDRAGQIPVDKKGFPRRLFPGNE